MKFANSGSGELAIYSEDRNLSWKLDEQAREITYRGQRMNIERPHVVRHMIFLSDATTRPVELADHPVVIRERTIGHLADGASTTFTAPDADQLEEFARIALEAFPEEPLARQLADLAA